MLSQNLFGILFLIQPPVIWPASLFFSFLYFLLPSFLQSSQSTNPTFIILRVCSFDLYPLSHRPHHSQNELSRPPLPLPLPHHRPCTHVLPAVARLRKEPIRNLARLRPQLSHQGRAIPVQAVPQGLCARRREERGYLACWEHAEL